MNTNKMTVSIADSSKRKAAKIAGAAYLFIILGSLLSMILVDAKLTVAGDTVATANNIMANELLFRIGITY